MDGRTGRTDKIDRYIRDTYLTHLLYDEQGLIQSLAILHSVQLYKMKVDLIIFCLAVIIHVHSHHPPPGCKRGRGGGATTT